MTSSRLPPRLSSYGLQTSSTASPLLACLWGSAEYASNALGWRAATKKTLVETLVQLPLSVQSDFLQLILRASLQSRLAHLMWTFRARTRRAALDRQMTLPLRHGVLGLQSDKASDAAFVAGAGPAERNLKWRATALCSLQGASGASVRGRWSSLLDLYAERRKRDAPA